MKKFSLLHPYFFFVGWQQKGYPATKICFKFPWIDMNCLMVTKWDILKMEVSLKVSCLPSAVGKKQPDPGFMHLSDVSYLCVMSGSNGGDDDVL